jgi:rSAM/selenodomain-associated transferase 1
MTCVLIIFAKAPVAGFAKTRLIPQLGPQGAAALAGHMLNHALEQARLANIGPVQLCCAPDDSHPDLLAAAKRHGATPTQQGEGDLGARMHRAFVRALSQHDSAIIIGTDAPSLDARYLRDAVVQLRTRGAVFGPAYDGGYTLIGLRHAHGSLFDQMPWSTAQVMALTRQRLSALGISHAELATLHDVDEPVDLAFLPADWPAMDPVTFTH